MQNKNKILSAGIAFFAALIIIFAFIKIRPAEKDPALTEIRVAVADLAISVSTTGVVEPQNRLEIKPPINGRIDEILVHEGEKVKRGRILALMSSTERAALLDAARAQGEEKIKYWQDVYKATPLISPIDGEVIVRGAEPGQTVTSDTAVIVLSDRLIVSAQFDETDIGRISVGQEAFITLDAYPNVKIKGRVDHIAYESEIVNNVTIYDVDVLPAEIPGFLRSGMSANVEVLEKKRENIMLIPLESVRFKEGKAFVIVKPYGKNPKEMREIKIGLRNEKNAEITSGLNPGDIIVYRHAAYRPSKKPSGGNPFMPFRGKNTKK